MKKIEHRTYTHSRGARFKSGDKELILRSPDSFQLTTYEGSPAVVKDGIVYFVKRGLLAELRNRSELLKPAKTYAPRVDFLNHYGLDIETALVKNLKKLAAGNKMSHGFKDGRVYCQFPMKTLKGMVSVMFYITDQSMGVTVLNSGSFDTKSLAPVPTLQQQAKKFAKYLTTKYDLTVNKFGESRAKVANLQYPEGAFSGVAYTYSARWAVK